MKLADLQDQFIDALYYEDGKDLQAEIKTGKLPKEELLNIYRRNLFLGLTNVLRITYPPIYQILGKQKFSEYAHEYIKNTRSISGNLDHYGKSFADFLSRQKQEGFLGDLAKLLWLKQASNLAADVQDIDLETLQNLTEEQLFTVRFELNPSCFLLASPYNLLIRRKRGKKNKSENYFIIFRQGGNVEIAKISRLEYLFLSEVEKGLGLYEIYEKHKINIQKYLPAYLANRVISDFSLGARVQK